MHRSTTVFCVSMFALMLAVAGCSQPGGPMTTLTSPSALFGAAASTADGAVSGTQTKRDEYDATGAWDAILTFPDGDTGSGVLDIVQDADGNLVGTASGDPGTYTFTRLGNGTGKTIGYKLTIVSPDPGQPGECGRDLSGTVTLDTASETMETRHLRGIVDDCSTIEFTISLTKQ